MRGPVISRTWSACGLASPLQLQLGTGARHDLVMGSVSGPGERVLPDLEKLFTK